MAVQAGDSQDDPLIGTQIGNYRIERLVGAGGMGRVYQAVQPAIGARVAIKVIGQRVADEELRARFFAEAKAVNLIRHERIVNIIDLQTLPDGRPCIVMEYLEGAPLDRLIASSRPFPLGTLTRLGIEILDALEAAHEQSIVHRDLKPANIFITPEGHAKLVDFGIAKLLDDPTTAQTMAGAVVGTTPYMSPEQAEADTLDGRSDIFALGVLLYEAATGQRPFKGDNIVLIRAQHELGAAPPETLRAEIPAELSAAIMQALAFDREQRFTNAAAMQRALGRVLEVLPPKAFAELDIDSVRPKELAPVSTVAPLSPPAPATKATVRERPTPTPNAHGPTDPQPMPRAQATDPQPDVGPARSGRVIVIGGVLAIAAVAGGAALLGVLARGEGRAGQGAGATDAAVAKPEVRADAQPADAQPAPITSQADAAVSATGAVTTAGLRPGEAVSVDSYLQTATRLARTHLRDAALVSIEAHGVNAAGMAGGSLTYRFVSPAAREARSDRCMVKVFVRREVVKVDSLPATSPSSCPAPAPTPRCTGTQVMQAFVKAKGVERALVQYSYRGWSAYTKVTGRWVMPSDACTE